MQGARQVLMRCIGAGTAGLRAIDGPGYNRMNAITVQQTAQGLVRYLQQQSRAGWNTAVQTEGPQLAQVDTSVDYLGNGVVVGFDGRTNSRRCACACVYAPAGSVYTRRCRGLLRRVPKNAPKA